MSLSERLGMLADMVTAGNSVADVGCDHAFLPIYLVQSGKCPGCLAMDVRKGPLLGAKEHIDFYGLGEYIKTRLSDGLASYQIGEAQTLICAGMGGRLMERILRAGGEKTVSFSELILQPQSEIGEFRAFLRKAGLGITEESAVCEDGKYYFAIKAAYQRQKESEKPENARQQSDQARQRLYDLYGKYLLEKRHPVLKQYLLHRVNTVEQLEERLKKENTAKSLIRLEELAAERGQLDAALEFF